MSKLVDWRNLEEQTFVEFRVISPAVWGGENKYFNLDESSAKAVSQNLRYTVPAFSLAVLRDQAKVEKIAADAIASLKSTVTDTWAISANFIPAHPLYRTVPKYAKLLSRSTFFQGPSEPTQLPALSIYMIHLAAGNWLGVQTQIHIDLYLQLREKAHVEDLQKTYFGLWKDRQHSLELQPKNENRLMTGYFDLMRRASAAKNSDAAAEYGVIASGIMESMISGSFMVPEVPDPAILQKVALKKRNLLKIHSMAVNEGFADYAALNGMLCVRQGVVDPIALTSEPPDPDGYLAQNAALSPSNPHRVGLQAARALERAFGVWAAYLMTTLSELPITKLAELIPSADLANYYKDPNWRPDSRLARLAEIASAYKGDRVDPANIVRRVIAPELDKGMPSILGVALDILAEHERRP